MKKIIFIILTGMVTQNTWSKIGIMDAVKIAGDVEQFQDMLDKKTIQDMATHTSKAFIFCKAKKGQAIVDCLSDSLIELKALISTLNQAFLAKGALLFDLANIAGEKYVTKISSFNKQLGGIGLSVVELALLLNPKNAGKVNKKTPANPIKLNEEQLADLDKQLDEDLDDLEDDL